MKTDDNKQRWWRQKKRYERKYVLVNINQAINFSKKVFHIFNLSCNLPWTDETIFSGLTFVTGTFGRTWSTRRGHGGEGTFERTCWCARVCFVVQGGGFCFFALPSGLFRWDGWHWKVNGTFKCDLWFYCRRIHCCLFLYISARRKKENEEKLLLVMNCKKKKIVPGVGGVVGDWFKTSLSLRYKGWHHWCLISFAWMRKVVKELLL